MPAEKLPKKFIAIYQHGNLRLPDKLKILNSAQDLKSNDQFCLFQPPEFNCFPEKKALLADISLKKKIKLLFPFKREEQRINSISLPAAHLFLGSALIQEGFEVCCEKLLLGQNSSADFSQEDFLGLTVFEENVGQLEIFFREQLVGFKGLLVLGGPFITLAGFSSLNYFNQANLFVRGEAEIVLPKILKAIAEKEIQELFNYQGLLFNWHNLLIISDFEQQNLVRDFTPISLQSRLFKREELHYGLELNLLRGCKRNCIFCSHLQKKRLRAFPLSNLKDFLVDFRKKLIAEHIENPVAMSVNINDDDILQDKNYFRSVLNLFQDLGYRLWGVQTSLEALFLRGSVIDREFINSLPEKVFVNRCIIFWIGTDVFCRKRAKRMLKFFPAVEKWNELLEILEAKKIEHFHYWILSDFLSDWQEFVTELSFIVQTKRNFSCFNVMPIAPFLIPYSHTPAFRFIYKLNRQKQILFQKINRTDDYPLVEKVLTPYPLLNRMLQREILPGESEDFFTLFKSGNFEQLWKLVYGFLRQEILQAADAEKQQELRKVQYFVEQII